MVAKGGMTETEHEKTFGVMEIFNTLIVMAVPCVYLPCLLKLFTYEKLTLRYRNVGLSTSITALSRHSNRIFLFFKCTIQDGIVFLLAFTFVSLTEIFKINIWQLYFKSCSLYI